MEKTISHSGATLSYQVHPKGDAPWLIFFHGWVSNHTILMPYVHYFKKSYNLLVPDLRGHGRSSNGEMSMEHLREDLKAIMDEEDIKQAHLLGHSLGATLAVDFAQVYPDHIKSLALATLSTKRYTFARPLVQALVHATIFLGKRKAPRAFQQYYNDDNTPKTFTVPLDLAGADKHALQASMRDCFAYEFSWDDVSVPTILFQGTYDPLAWNHRLRLDTQQRDQVQLHCLPTQHLVTTHAATAVMQKLEVFWHA